MTILVEKLQKGFSRVSNKKEALALCGPNTVLSLNETGLVEPMDIATDNEFVVQAVGVVGTLLKVALIDGGCDATHRLYMGPVLDVAATIVGTIVMKVEECIEIQAVNGDVDYHFQNMNVPPLTICVTEGKHGFGLVSTICRCTHTLHGYKRKN